MDMKRCTKCQHEYPATSEYFNRDRSRYDGLHPYCKTCRNALRKQEYQDKPELREQCQRRSIDWYYSHLEYRRETRKVEYWRNRTDNIAAVRRWREEHPEQYREGERARKQRHYREHPELYVNYTRNRRARLRNSPGHHTAEDVRILFEKQNGLCFWCHQPLTASYHVDHVIPTSRGGSNDPSNLVVACRSCNTSKNDRLPSEWRPITTR